MRVPESDGRFALPIRICLKDKLLETAFGVGLLAKVQPGSNGVFEWRKINNEVWRPYREDFTAKLRILLVKGQHMRELHEYSDFRKCVVKAEIKTVDSI